MDETEKLRKTITGMINKINQYVIAFHDILAIVPMNYYKDEDDNESQDCESCLKMQEIARKVLDMRLR
jgi:hypothetical protein